MNFNRLISNTDEMFSQAMDLYSASFPDYEQRTRKSQCEVLKNCDYHFDLIYDNQIFVGLLLYWETDNFIYIEHFCVVPDLRGHSYGTKALELLALKRKKIILEIDPLNDENSIRRNAFYERSGYITNTFQHIHPPYKKGNTGHALVIMSYPCHLTEEVYQVFFCYLKSTVMGPSTYLH